MNSWKCRHRFDWRAAVSRPYGKRIYGFSIVGADALIGPRILG